MTNTSKQFPKELANDAVDRALAGLGEAAPPAGLERRVLRHLEERATAPQPASRWRFYVAATACLLLIASLAMHTLHRTDQVRETIASTSATVAALPAAPPLLLTLAPSTHAVRTSSRAARAAAIEPANPAPTSDELALAETLAPSHPAPAQPLTQQERLLAEASRQGQPMEVAALEVARQPLLKAAAEARERAHMEHFVHAVLAPLLLAESFNPTPIPQSTGIAEPARDNSSSSSSPSSSQP